MDIPKPSGEDKARFHDLVPPGTAVEIKPMFGNLAAFVNGNMFMGLFGADIGVKLPPDGLEEVIAVGGGPFGPPERPMGGYVAVPRSMDDAHVRALASRALSYVALMPAKAPKKPKAK